MQHFAINLDPSQSGAGVYIVHTTSAANAVLIFLVRASPEDSASTFLEVKPATAAQLEDRDSIFI